MASTSYSGWYTPVSVISTAWIGHAVARDGADPPEGLLHGQRVAGGMVQDVERLAVAGHLAHVLAERPVVDLDPGSTSIRSSPAGIWNQ